ncbi:MAG: 4Fe-4S dicluster domain-containing protein [bacterium]
MVQKFITKEELNYLISRLIKEGKIMIAPAKVKNSLLFSRISSPIQIKIPHPLAKKSLKEFFFPPRETLFRFTRENGHSKLIEESPNSSKTVIFAARPCDAAALPILDEIFGWDYLDVYYFDRRKSTTIISLGCSQASPGCFCGSVGLSPHSSQGSDILLTELDSGGYLGEIESEKGENLGILGQDPSPDQRKEAERIKEKAIESLEIKLNPEQIKNWLDKNFDHSHWQEVGNPCLGCGICAYLCPTCHCFDIVDEGGFWVGEREKIWDSCCFGDFTKHAAGHNPRDLQYKRYRQRIMHKFKIYPDRFGKNLCTGCGRCSRYCPVNLDLSKTLAEIQEMALNG